MEGKVSACMESRRVCRELRLEKRVRLVASVIGFAMWPWLVANESLEYPGSEEDALSGLWLRYKRA